MKTQFRVQLMDGDQVKFQRERGTTRINLDPGWLIFTEKETDLALYGFPGKRVKYFTVRDIEEEAKNV